MEIVLWRAQRRVVERGIPVILVFEGWDLAAQGQVINGLAVSLDPRGFTVHGIADVRADGEGRPPWLPFAVRTPARGRIAIFDVSWYRRLFDGVARGKMDGEETAEACLQARRFERMLADDGVILLKFFLDVKRSTLKKSVRHGIVEPLLGRLMDRASGRFRKYEAARVRVMNATDASRAPWIVVPSDDHLSASRKVVRAMASAVAAASQGVTSRPVRTPAVVRADFGLPNVDLSRSLKPLVYERELDRCRERLRDLQRKLLRKRECPVVLVFEGWDAAGKGGTIKRLARSLDPRGYEVIPIGAPSAEEKAHHYLWRFWTRMPGPGRIAIFDRSWYGRVLVERVEAFCSTREWRRAYGEIADMERELAEAGTLILKFWLHIGEDEQLRRFEDRERTPWKQWKITAEDWRNRKRWPEYERAVEDMVRFTSVPGAPWHVIPFNSKPYGRIAVLDTVVSALDARL
jgi:polyphosphate:AMP phosphotransferase